MFESGNLKCITAVDVYWRLIMQGILENFHSFHHSLCSSKIIQSLFCFLSFFLRVCDVGNVGDVCLFRRVPLPFVCLV